MPIRTARQYFDSLQDHRQIYIDGRQRLYERYYSGDPTRSQSAMFRRFPSDEHIQRIHDMLDDLKERQNPDWKTGGAAFRKGWE